MKQKRTTVQAMSSNCKHSDSPFHFDSYRYFL